MTFLTRSLSFCFVTVVQLSASGKQDGGRVGLCLVYGATVYAMSRSDVPLQCIVPPTMHVVAWSPAFQPRYPIDRIKSLAGDVIVFGVLPLIILSTTTLSTPGLLPRRTTTLARRSNCAWRAVAVYRLPDAVRSVSVYVPCCLPACLLPTDRITSRSLRQILSSVGKHTADELERCWLSRLT